MKLNDQLAEQLKKYEKDLDSKILQTTASAREADAKQNPPKICRKSIEKVVGGDIIWKPVDKAASKLISKAPWWAHPPSDISSIEIKKKETPNKKPKKIKPMVKHASELNCDVGGDTYKKWVVFGDWAVEVKSFCKRTGEPLMDQIDLWPVLLEQMNKMQHELTPAARAMIEAEKTLRDSTKTARECMEDLRSSSKVFLDEIRQTKYAMLAETSALVLPLKELRQFFIGKDYEMEMNRLKEFTDLCERLQKLKQSGFLDSVADTMIKLSQ